MILITSSARIEDVTSMRTCSARNGSVFNTNTSKRRLRHQDVWFTGLFHAKRENVLSQALLLFDAAQDVVGGADVPVAKHVPDRTRE